MTAVDKPAAPGSTEQSRRGLAALLAAETVSTAGTRMSELALPWLVLTGTGSPIATGLVGTAEIAPYVVTELLGAPLVDRLGGKRVFLAGNVAAGAALLAVPLLWRGGALGLPALLGLVFLAGLARGPANAAGQVMLPPMTEAAGMSIDRATALVDGASRTATVVGTPLAGAIIPLLGGANVVLADAASFLAAAGVVLVLIPVAAGRTAGEGTGPRDGYLATLTEGLKYVMRHRLLRSIAGMVAFTNLADAAVMGLLIVLWAQQRYGSTEQLGAVTAVMFAGAVAGTLVMAARGSRLPRRKTFAIAFLAAGAPRLLVLALAVPLWAVLLVWAVSGVAAGAINPILSAAQYDVTPRRLQARAFSAVHAVAWAGMPVGALLAGALVDATGLGTALVLGAVVYGLVTLDPFVRSGWSAMDRRTG
jgi:MFS family permease